MHYVDNPLERWAFIRTKAREDGWLSATNVLNPPTGSEPFGVDGYKTVAYELASDPRTAHADTIVVPTARGDLLWGIYAGYRELVEERAIEQMPRLVAVEPFPRLELALAGTDWRGAFAGTSPMVSINGSTLAYQAVAAIERSRGLAVSVDPDRVIQDQQALARAGFYLELSAAASLTGLRLASTQDRDPERSADCHVARVQGSLGGRVMCASGGVHAPPASHQVVSFIASQSVTP